MVKDEPFKRKVIRLEEYDPEFVERIRAAAEEAKYSSEEHCRLAELNISLTTLCGASRIYRRAFVREGVPPKVRQAFENFCDTVDYYLRMMDDDLEVVSEALDYEAWKSTSELMDHFDELFGDDT